MKRAIAILLFTVLTLMTFSLGINAAVEKKEYQMPKATFAPTIDGIKSDGEWDNALARILTPADVTEKGTTFGAGFLGAKFYWIWSDAGLYFFADVTDDTASVNTPQSVDAVNNSDCIQFIFYAGAETGAGKMFFFSLNPVGNFGLTDHFVFSDGTKGAAVTGSETASKVNGTNYTLEGFIPVTALNMSTPPIEISEGATLKFGNIVMAYQSDGYSIYMDCDAFFDPTNCNTYVLTNTPANTTGADTTAVDTTATNPQTGSSSVIVPAAIVAVIFCAVLITTKKSKKVSF